MAFCISIGSKLGRSISQCSGSSMMNAIRCLSSDSSKIFVGGLSFETDEDALKEAFSQFGEVEEVTVVYNNYMARSRGFGFIKFTDVEAANNALAMDGQDLQGRKMYVSIANERPQGPARGGFGGSYLDELHKLSNQAKANKDH